MAYPNSAPELSTPATQIFKNKIEDPCPHFPASVSEEGLFLRYEIQRTVSEIRKWRYTRVALQFPDSMLRDAPRVFKALQCGLRSSNRHQLDSSKPDQDVLTRQAGYLSVSDQKYEPKLYILGDTSYGACCVDEIAAEHINADVIVHYGRACLSPTARLPVIYVFTVQPQPPIDHLCREFEKLYSDKHQKIVLMADVTYQSHLPAVLHALQNAGFDSLYATEVQADPLSLLPNRTIPQEVQFDPPKLKEWHVFHLSAPPESLLLTLSSRVAGINIFPTHSASIVGPGTSSLASTSRALNRRYALLTSVSTAPIFGILINTLSVKNYLRIAEHVKGQISAAGKKSYTFVVGKVNAAKVANFSEVGAWVVIGCWESSLIDSKDFWKPIITPFELEMALKANGERIWTGEWISDYQRSLDTSAKSQHERPTSRDSTQSHANVIHEGDFEPEAESQPPEFDLRSGKYISHTRPMQLAHRPTINSALHPQRQNTALSKRTRADVATVDGNFSPGADFLQTQRSWKGLGSDHEIAYEKKSTSIEEGRSGIARGYAHEGSEEIER